MLNKAKTIVGRAWAYALRKSEFLRFVFRADAGETTWQPENNDAAWFDTDWEGE